MKLKLKTIYEAIPALQHIARSEIKAKSAFKISCLLKDLDKYFSSIEKERNKLLDELGIKNKDGNMELKPIDKNYPIFIEQWNNCLDVDIDFNLEFQINLDDLENITITPAQMQTIDVFIKKEKNNA
jgi:hypothetical protein